MVSVKTIHINPAGIYLFKVNNGNTRTICKMCSKLIIKTQERRQYHSGVFIVNFEQTSHIALVFPADLELLNANRANKTL